MPQTIVIASGNAGKLREIRRALADFSVHLPAQSEFGIAPAAEPHPTFLENALAKARHAARQTGLPALADDSGIAVDALNGAPGVLSARYAGDAADDEKNCRKLLAALGDNKNRRAFYYAAMVYVAAADDPAPIVAEGFWRGEIAAAAAGDGGFGYDPIFFDRRRQKTGAQMSIAEKERVSHRGQSLRRLAATLRRRGYADS